MGINEQDFGASAVRTALTITLVMATAGCGGDGGGSGPAHGWTTTTDSLPGGGVRVVHTPPEDVRPTWRLEPDLRIGSMDGTGPDVFGDLRDIAVSDDGRIAVIDGQAQEVRIFAPDGSHLRTFGGQGGGPGEFENANGVAFGSDGLLRVPDAGNNRLSFFHPDSGFVGSHRYEPLMYGYTWDGQVDEDGDTWSLHYRLPTSPDQNGRMVYQELARDGTPGDTIVRVEQPRDPNAGMWELELSDGRRANLGIPSYPHAQFALDPEQRVWSTAQDDPAYRLIRWTATGDTALTLEVRRPPVATDMAAVDSQLSGWEERFGVTLDRSDIPETAPGIQGFFFDDDGRLWVRARTTTDSVRTFDAFDADTGEYLGTLTTDLGLQTYQWPVVRGGTLWGIVRDELDVPGVVRGRVVEAGPGEVDG